MRRFLEHISVPDIAISSLAASFGIIVMLLPAFCWYDHTPNSWVAWTGLVVFGSVCLLVIALTYAGARSRRMAIAAAVTVSVCAHALAYLHTGDPDAGWEIVLPLLLLASISVLGFGLVAAAVAHIIDQLKIARYGASDSLDSALY